MPAFVVADGFNYCTFSVVFLFAPGTSCCFCDCVNIINLISGEICFSAKRLRKVQCIMMHTTADVIFVIYRPITSLLFSHVSSFINSWPATEASDLLWLRVEQLYSSWRPQKDKISKHTDKQHKHLYFQLLRVCECAATQINYVTILSYSIDVWFRRDGRSAW